ncbi:MAG: phosphoglycolate phosphatase [Gammaproteobacteria bacterium]
MIRRPQAILFDLDGTLVDSVPDLTFSVNAMLRQLDRAPVEETTVRRWVGNGAERLVKRALTGEMEAEPDTALYERAYPLFLEAYADHVMVDSRLFPGVEAGLQALQQAGFAMGCITNKPERFTTPLLTGLGIDHYFAIQVSGDTLPVKKPDPRPLRYAAEFFKVPPERMLMVGDSRNDVQAARAAGSQIVCVPYGYNHGEDIRTANPDAVIDDLTQLPDLIRQAA